MTLTFLTDSFKIADLATLKALTERRDGAIKVIDSISSTTPPYNLKDVTYRYDASSSIEALEPAIIEPDDSSGRWIMQSPRLIFNTLAPSNPPALADLTWIAFLTVPDRKVIWRSRPDLSDTPVIEDWIPDYLPIAIDAIPSFSADFENQVVRDSNTEYIYKAINLSGDWILSLQDNGFVAGTDIVGDETLTIASHGTIRKLTANAIVTLPASLSFNIELKLLIYGALSLTLRPDAGTTLNEGTVDIPASDTVVTLFNTGDSWYAY